MLRGFCPDDTVVARAHAFAAQAHRCQVRRYTGEPYVVHCQAVGTLLAAHGFAPHVVAAGYLHDVIEDCGVAWTQIADTFDSRIALLVLEVTDVSTRHDGDRAARKAKDRAHLATASAEGQSIKLADLIDNTKSIVAHDPKFAVVYLQEKRALLEVLTKGHPALLGECAGGSGTYRGPFATKETPDAD